MSKVLRLALMLAVIHAPEVAAADDLGRLFFTPQQRQDLDRRRATNAQEAATVTREDTVRLSGHVSRSSGKTTTWINGVRREDSYRSPDPSKIDVQAEGEPTVTLKIGQSLDRVRGETRDALGGGQLKVEKKPPPAR